MEKFFFLYESLLIVMMYVTEIFATACKYRTKYTLRFCHRKTRHKTSSRMHNTYRHNAIATASFLVPRSFSDLGRCLDVVLQLVVIPKVE